MRSLVVLSLLLGVASHCCTAQSIPVAHEFRYQVLVTLPRVHGFAGTIVLEQHLEADDLAPNERVQGVGIVSPLVNRMSVGSELRQVVTPTGVEHRYIETFNAAVPLLAGFEWRNRARTEIRDVAGTWSHRYQDRAILGHDLSLMRHTVFSYVQENLSYDSRYATINRQEATVGIRVPVTAGSSIDSYVTRSNDVRRTPHLLVASGVTIRVAL